MYKRIDSVYKAKDFRNNFCKEDDSTTTYRDAIESLAHMQLINCSNLAVVTLKRELYDQCIQHCNDALEIEHKHIKALYLKGKALIGKTEYQKAIEVFKTIIEIEADNKDAT